MSPGEFRPEYEMVLRFIDEVRTQRRLNKVHDYMDRDLPLHTIGDRTVIRPERYQADLLDMVGPFPDARFAVRDIQTNFSPRYASLRVAVLWTMHGTYRGTPAFGPITGKTVTVLGVSQFLIQERRIVKEVRVHDEVSPATRADQRGPRGRRSGRGQHLLSGLDAGGPPPAFRWWAAPSTGVVTRQRRSAARPSPRQARSARACSRG